MALSNHEGRPVPNVTFNVRVGNDWTKVTTDQLFRGKRVMVFALPGAFTPTCSSTHLPRYNELVSAFRAHGIDDVICLSVNDTFVMNEWARDQECENLTLLPDGNGEFTEGMGMLVDKRNLGFGKRSWRYSMLVNDGIVEKMFIEPEVERDPFEVSDADTMLEYIAPDAKKPAQVVIFSKPGCPFCAEAKEILAARGYVFSEIPLENHNRGKILGAVSGSMTAPQVFIDGQLIGGLDDLKRAAL